MNKGSEKWYPKYIPQDYDLNYIGLFNIDSGRWDGGAVNGVIDEVIIHQGVCLYKEDFTIDPESIADFTPPIDTDIANEIRVY